MKNFVERMAEIFKALGDPTRLRIIRILASNTEDRFCVVDIAIRVGITQSAVSQHIRILKHLNLLDSERKGYRVYYSVNADVIKEFKVNMDELFRKAFIKCSRDIPCSECPEREDCSDM